MAKIYVKNIIRENNKIKVVEDKTKEIDYALEGAVNTIDNFLTKTIPEYLYICPKCKKMGKKTNAKNYKCLIHPDEELYLEWKVISPDKYKNDLELLDRLKPLINLRFCNINSTINGERVYKKLVSINEQNLIK